MNNRLTDKINYNKFYFYSFLLFAFTLPLSKAAISLFIIIIPLVWMIEGNYGVKFEKLKSNPLITVFFFYLLLSILSLLWTDDIVRGLSDLKKLLYFLTACVIFTSLKKEDIQKVITAFLLGMFISELVSYGIYFELIDFKDKLAQNPSPFMHHMYYSVFLVLASLILLNRIFSKSYTQKEKIIFLIFFITITGNLFIGIGRTGQIIFLVGVIITTLLNFRVSIKSLAISLSIVFIIFFSAYNLSQNFESRVERSATEVTEILNMNLNTSWGIRVAYWITTYNILIQNPFGIGYGDYLNATKDELNIANKYDYLTLKTKKFMILHHPHNQFLLILLQTGIIGLLLFLLFIYRLMTLNIKDRELKNLNIIFTSIIIISCFAGPQFYRHFPLALIVLFIGLFLKATEIKDQNG